MPHKALRLLLCKCQRSSAITKDVSPVENNNDEMRKYSGIFQLISAVS